MPLLSNLARVRQERKERWRRGEVWWSAFVVVEERCLPGESLSSVTATSDQHCVCSRCVQGVSDVRNAACPIRPAVHVPRQPTTALLHPVCLSMPAHAAHLQRDMTYSFSCSSVIV